MSVTVGNDIYVCGGHAARQVDVLNLCAKYSTSNKEWEYDIPPMPVSVFGGAMGTDGRRIYVLGGIQEPLDDVLKEDLFYDMELSYIWVYDP